MQIAFRALQSLLLAAALSGCGQDDAVEPFECNYEEQTVCPDPMPHYADVEPVFESRCATGACHTGATSDGPWPLDSYSHVADWYDLIRDELRGCTMPPPDSTVHMSAEERELVLAWLLCGFPE